MRRLSTVLLLIIVLFLVAALPVGSQEGVPLDKEPQHAVVPLSPPMEGKLIELPDGKKLHLKLDEGMGEGGLKRSEDRVAQAQGDWVNTIFFDDMESGVNGWTVVTDGGTVLWHQVTNPEIMSVLGPVDGGCLAPPFPPPEWPNDINPDLVYMRDIDKNGVAWLPSAYSGSTAWWFGADSNGTYIDDPFNAACASGCRDGGDGCAAHQGMLVSPWIDLSTVKNAAFSYYTWWEVEGERAQLGYDAMWAMVSTDGVNFEAVDYINDEAPPAWIWIPSVPWSSWGANMPGIWVKRTADLTRFVGQPIQIAFFFDTVDVGNNGFRGWFIDDVRVVSGPRIGGFVYHDVDGNGVRGSPDEEPGVDGAVVELVETGETYITGTSGWYSFNLLPPGTYTVRLLEVPPWWKGITSEECVVDVWGPGGGRGCDFGLWWGMDTPLETVALRAVKDADISIWEQERNNGAAAHMRVRQPGMISALVQFDLSTVPADARIVKATLRLYGTGWSNEVHRLYMTAYNLTRDWAEDQVTWEQAADGQPWEAPGAVGEADHGPPAGWAWVYPSSSPPRVQAEFDVTELVKEWLADPAGNHGVLIRGEGSGHHEVEWQFLSRNSNAVASAKPHLEINYIAP